VGAIAFPLFRDDVVLADDFSTPEALRRWPEDQSMAYVDGDYRMTVSQDEGGSRAYVDLPSHRAGVAIEVDADVMQGVPVIVVACVSHTAETGQDAGSVTVEDQGSYMFLVDATRGRYAILGPAGTRPLATGAFATGSGNRLSFSCLAMDEPARTMLRGRVGSSDALEFTDPGTADSFESVSLGVYGANAGAEVAFDNLRVTALEPAEGSM
jgi:hypothetical protein